MTKAPIALFAYKRLLHLRKTVDALQKNIFSDISNLYIFIDGPKDSDSVGDVRDVISFAQQVSGFKSVSVVERKRNLGLANSIIDGVSYMCNKFGSVIVLEDDMLTAPYFLQYMNEALDYYADNSQVISVHGYAYPTATRLPEAFFLRGADCWGWGTWKRGWNIFNPNGQVLLDRLNSQNLTKAFDFDGAYPYTKMLKDQIAGRNDSWAIRWHASAFLANKLTLYPGNSLVANIGNDSSGTHCETSSQYDVQLSANPIDLNGLAVAESKEGRDAFKAFFLANKRSILQRLANKFSSLLGRK